MAKHGCAVRLAQRIISSENRSLFSSNLAVKTIEIVSGLLSIATCFFLISAIYYYFVSIFSVIEIGYDSPTTKGFILFVVGHLILFVVILLYTLKLLIAFSLRCNGGHVFRFIWVGTMLLDVVFLFVALLFFATR